MKEFFRIFFVGYWIFSGVAMFVAAIYLAAMGEYYQFAVCLVGTIFSFLFAWGWDRSLTQ
jgi:hypothetical protein